jgi:hypothetical protein
MGIPDYLHILSSFGLIFSPSKRLTKQLGLLKHSFDKLQALIMLKQKMDYVLKTDKI